MTSGKFWRMAAKRGGSKKHATGWLAVMRTTPCKPVVLPVAKREKHRLALRRAATSGHSAYFLGTDSAPHVDALKEHACGCAGCFTATNTMPLLAHIFEEEGALNRLEAFASQNGAAFYGLPQNEAMITLVKSAQAAVFPPKIPSESGPVTVFDPGFAVHWHVQA